MIELKRVFPECYSDTLLVELILQRGKPGHRKGISKVVKALIDYEPSHEFIIGIADTDKFKRDAHNPLLSHFEIFEDRFETDGLRIFRKPNTQKYLIRLNPAFESWIWKQASICKIKPEEFGFHNLEDLINASKDNAVEENSKLKSFVSEVIKKNSPAIKTLREWLVKVLPTDQQKIILAMFN
ncbi:MAG: hypothetical protein HY064_09425 [Bacteroidetes bacterium]|nr:hypothetical protein [Bacteroidota bacterium]